MLTCSGGDSGIAGDEAERIGVPLPQLAPDTEAKLEKLLPAEATIANPLDYTAIIWGDVERLRDITAAVGADPSIEQLMVLYDHPQNMFGPGAESWDDVRAGIIAGAEVTDASVLVSSTLPDLIDDAACEELSVRGVVPLSGVRTALSVARALRRPPGDPARIRAIAAAAAGAAEGGEWLDEAGAKALLAESGIAVPQGEVAADADAAVAAWREIGGPVALKLSAPGLLHKSEAGALELGLNDEDEIRASFERLSSIEAPAGGRVLVEAMATPEVELLVGARRDGVVPSLAIGFGGHLDRGAGRRRRGPASGLARAGRAGDPLAARGAAADRRARAGSRSTWRAPPSWRRGPATRCSSTT